jgi:hypothetical protein
VKNLTTYVDAKKIQIRFLKITESVLTFFPLDFGKVFRSLDVRPFEDVGSLEASLRLVKPGEGCLDLTNQIRRRRRSAVTKNRHTTRTSLRDVAQPSKSIGKE